MGCLCSNGAYCTSAGGERVMKECNFPFLYGEKKGEVCDYDCTYCTYYYEKVNISECVEPW